MALGLGSIKTCKKSEVHAWGSESERGKRVGG